MQNFILFSTPRSCSTHVCDIVGNHLLHNNVIKNNLYEYYNVYAWFFSYHQTTKQIVEANSPNSYFVDYNSDEHNCIHEMVYKDIARYVPESKEDRQEWMTAEIARRGALLASSPHAYLYKLFPLNLPEFELLNCLRSSNVIALTRRDVIEQILSLYFVQLNNNNYNIRSDKYALRFQPNTIDFNPAKYQGLLEKNLNRIRLFNDISKKLSLTVNYYEDLANLSNTEILKSLGLTGDFSNAKSRYVPINLSGYPYYELIKNKTDVDSWFKSYAGDLIC